MTVDKSRPAKTRGKLPKFTPVPRQTQRHDGWTPERQQRFIEALAAKGTVKSAALAVNMSSESAYQLRRHPEAKQFSKAWKKALSFGVHHLRDIARERAIDGIDVPIVYRGEIVGTKKHYDPRLLTFSISQDDKRYIAAQAAKAAKANSPNTRKRLARLKKQWAREQASESADREQQHAETLIERIDTLHRHWFCALGPEARQAYRAFREAEIAGGQDPHRWTAAYPEARAEQFEEEGGGELAARLQAERTADYEAAEREYAEWFDDERRAKIEWVIDVVFGAVSAPRPGDRVGGG